MSQYQFHLILRYFYSYSCDLFILFKNGKISGYLLKSDIESMLSDLSAIQNSNDKLPIKILQNTDHLIQLFNQYGITKEGKKVLPSLDSNLEFSAFWPIDELIKSFEAVPNVRKWNPEDEENVRKQEPSKTIKEKISIINVETNFNQWKNRSGKNNQEKLNTESLEASHKIIEPNNLKDKNISSDKKESLPQKKPPTNIIDNYTKKNLNQYENKISLYTLETLPIPMMAIDKKGEIIFHNNEWERIYKLIKSDFSTHNLLEKTRDEMARLAFEGSFEKDTIISVLEYKAYHIKCKSIIGHNFTVSLGYLFWAEKNAEQENIKNPSPSSVSKSEKVESNGYLGSTLPEILEREEKKVLAWAFSEAGNNYSNAAMLLGIPRQTFTYRYKKLFPSKKNNE